MQTCLKKMSLGCIAAASLIAGSVLTIADEAPKVVVGKPAPDFTATGIDGKPFKLSDKLKDGKKNVALMFSRASW